jgi:hypothetical protein
MNLMASLALFLSIAFGISVLVGLSIFLGGGPSTPFAVPALILMMFAPSLGTIAATRPVAHQSLRAHGLEKSKPLFYILAWTYPLVFVIVGLGLAALLHMATLDFGNLQRQLLESRTINSPALVIALLLIAPLINFIPALGEE